jgi:hypothetical protein
MFGEGISLVDLMQLLNAIRQKELVLQVKIIDEPWADLSQTVLLAMIQAVTSGKITQSDDIRLRLFSKKN